MAVENIEWNNEYENDLNVKHYANTWPYWTCPMILATVKL